MSDNKMKSRLGRGLSSLISISPDVSADQPAGATDLLDSPSTAVAQNEQPNEIPLGDIVPNPHQPRRTINPAAIAELAASLKSTGLIQPIIVRKGAVGYELIAGERRWRAAKQAGFDKIPAIIRQVDRFTQAQMALVENIQREDLNPLDRAAAYRAIIEQLNLTQAELANRLGEDRSNIPNHLRLLDLPESVRQLVKDAKVSLGHAKLLAGVASVVDQERLAALIVAGDLSVRKLEQLIQDLGRDPTANGTPRTSAYISQLEKSIARQLGLRVRVKTAAKKGSGRLVIHYNTLDEFDRLMQLLGVKPEE
jgi:ParB family chromosome partitioning protein